MSAVILPGSPAVLCSYSMFYCLCSRMLHKEINKYQQKPSQVYCGIVSLPPLETWVCNDFGQVVHTLVSCHQAVQFITGDWTETTCGWEGNHASHIALVMRLRLHWFIQLRAQWSSMGDDHTIYATSPQIPRTDYRYFIAYPFFTF